MKRCFRFRLINAKGRGRGGGQSDLKLDSTKRYIKCTHKISTLYLNLRWEVYEEQTQKIRKTDKKTFRNSEGVRRD